MGARYDLYRIETDDSPGFGAGRALDFDAFSGSVGLSVPFSRKSSAGFSVARAFRAPTVEELFSNAFHAAVGTFDIGNPELRAETNLGVEGVVRAQTEVLNLQLSAYHNRIDDYITPNIVGDTLIADEGASVSVPINIFRQQDADHSRHRGQGGGGGGAQCGDRRNGGCDRRAVQGQSATAVPA